MLILQVKKSSNNELLILTKIIMEIEQKFLKILGLMLEFPVDAMYEKEIAVVFSLQKICMTLLGQLQQSNDKHH